MLAHGGKRQILVTSDERTSAVLAGSDEEDVHGESEGNCFPCDLGPQLMSGGSAGVEVPSAGGEASTMLPLYGSLLLREEVENNGLC